MKALMRKELISMFCSGVGLIFALVFLIACGAMLWIFEGGFNILDGGYATLEKFFSLSSILFLVLIPALTMRLIAEEKKSRTMDLLRSRPFGISSVWFSKWVSTFLFIILVVLSTLVYVYAIYVLGSPVGNFDAGIVIVSYLSLLLLSAVFISIGLFASSITSNQIIAFFVGLLLNFILFYGFEMLSGVASNANLQSRIASIGLLHHFNQLQRGVIEPNNLFVFAFYFILSWGGTMFVLGQDKKSIKRGGFVVVATLALLLVFGMLLNFRVDFTKDKRYTLNDYSIELMQDVAKSEDRVEVKVYLNGNLNTGFERLRKSTSDLLTDLNHYAGHKLDVVFVDPFSLNMTREQVPEFMASQNMSGILLNEVDRNGKMSQQLIFPYAQIISETDTLEIPLLKNAPGYTAEENLNASAEDLEFQFVDALRLLVRNQEKHIAFIEGHGELARLELYDAEELLAKYYNVNRGRIGYEVSELDIFDVIVIAGAKESFSEREKYIIDQYIMRGGSVFWLIDGVYVSLNDIYDYGSSASIKNETNLDDLLFTYGVRIQPVLLQDAQCLSIMVRTSEDSPAVKIPWYYAPLLLPSIDNVITQRISVVVADFVSGVDVLTQNNDKVEANVLLTTSTKSHVVSVPEAINFNIEHIQSDSYYFDQSFLPVAVSLEGEFRSAFENRSVPDSIISDGYTTLTKSEKSRMIVAASSDIIRNDVLGDGSDMQTLPMGFDYVSKRQYGNRNFIVNAVNWLAGGDDMMELRSNTQQLNLLNKQKIYEERSFYAALNMLVPVFLVLLTILSVCVWRFRKYAKL